MILDGWGYGKIPSVDAIAQAKTPFFDNLQVHYPHATLVTHGMDVGLPEGQMGNSEVGHLNIGAGRIVYQELARINKAVGDGELEQNPVLKAAIAHAIEHQKPIHLLGLLSDGGVHSHIKHLKSLVDILDRAGVPKTLIHAFTDGRDTDPKAGKAYVEDLLDHIKGKASHLATLIGRYYAMDRDKRWERVAKAYNLLVIGVGEHSQQPLQSIADEYSSGITDEFLEPIVCCDMAGNPYGFIQPDDVVLCFNFRTDRLRELCSVLSQAPIEEFGMKPMPLYFVTMTRYDEHFHDIHVIFQKDDIRQTLGEVLANAGKSQLRIAETEKYPHVTFFFSGGREDPFPKEDRIMIPSAKVATYDLQPEMSAIGIKDAVMDRIAQDPPDFICLNFANTDMVGHTGVFAAAMLAAETVDRCLSEIVPQALAAGYEMILIADHGNSDFMINADGSPNTAHTMNPVPIILVGNHVDGLRLKSGRLADVATTILHRMGIPVPLDMTGDDLVAPL